MYGYYDSVEAPTEKGRVYVVFNKYHSYPQYLVTYNYGTETYEPEDGKCESKFRLNSILVFLINN